MKGTRISWAQAYGVVMHATHYLPRLFCQRIWNKSGLALFAGSVVLATVTEAEESNPEIKREMVAAEEDLQAQNGSPPTAQLSAALETELKKALERAQLAEKMADLAKSQRSVLEAELKKALERAQLAEKMADLTERKLSALEAALAEKDDQLETELKKALERAQLAGKNSHLSDPNADPKAEPLASIQPSDSSVQSAETTARPGPAFFNSVSSGIESRNEENKGIGFTEAIVLIAVEADPAPKNDLLTPDQQPVKLVRINQSRSPVPPSAAASMQSTTPEAQTDTVIRASREVQSLKELILEYHRLTMISPQENSFPQVRTPDSTEISVPALASEVNQPNVQANAGPESLLNRHDSARVIPPKILNIRHRSFVRSRFLDIKMRLIALWHQSLERSQRARSRTLLSNSNKDATRRPMRN